MTDEFGCHIPTIGSSETNDPFSIDWIIYTLRGPHREPPENSLGTLSKPLYGITHVNPAFHAIVSSSTLWSRRLANKNYQHIKRIIYTKTKWGLGAPEWLSLLSICLQLRSWFWSAGTELHVGFSAQQGVCFSFFLSLFLCPSTPSALSFSLSLALVHSLLQNK